MELRRAAIALLIAGAASRVSSKPPSPPEPYRTWLEEEVVHIISDAERDAFLSITEERIRSQFVEAFWEARDPTKGTPRNEFRDEHARRVQQANQLFSRGKKRPGWKTPRGKTWIQLGEPRDRITYPMEARSQPIEQWFYQTELDSRLPRFFYVLFFVPYGVGDYELYDPVIHGPEKLVGGYLQQGGFRERDNSDEARRRREFASGGVTGEAGQRGDSGGGLDNDRKRALRTLRYMSPILARAALSPVPTDAVDMDNGRVLGGANIVVSRLHDYGNYMPVDRGYVERVLHGEVDVDWQYGRMGLGSSFFGTFSPEGGQLHYLIEIPPESLTLSRYGKDTSGAFEVSGRVFGEDGITAVAEIDAHAELHLDPKELERVRAHPLAFIDSLPLLPGSYVANLVVRNLVTKKMSVVEGRFQIPDRVAGQLRVGTALIARERKERSADGAPLPFQLGGGHWLPAPDSKVGVGGTLLAACPVDAPAATPVAVHWTIRDGRQNQVKQGEAAGGHGQFVARIEVPLEGLGEGTYDLEVTASSSELAAHSHASRFEISPHAKPTTPWLYVHPRAHGGVDQLAIANQLLERGRDQDALAALAVATADPVTAGDARIRMAELYLRDRDFRRAVAAITPIALRDNTTPYALLLLGLGRSGGGDSAGAIQAYEQAVELSPRGTRFWNLLGEESMRAGLHGKATLAFERSLAIDPEQETVRALFTQLATPTPIGGR